MRDEAVPGTTRYRRSSAEHGAWRQPRVPQAFQPKRRSRFGVARKLETPDDLPKGSGVGRRVDNAYPVALMRVLRGETNVRELFD